MYQYFSHLENQLLLPDDFFLPLGGKLNKENRWVKLAQLVPWAYAEKSTPSHSVTRSAVKRRFRFASPSARSSFRNVCSFPTGKRYSRSWKTPTCNTSLDFQRIRIIRPFTRRS